ncbi:MAG: hypothetical protein AMXMBFR56_48890 [Polyangiaceae bacterium]
MRARLAFRLTAVLSLVSSLAWATPAETEQALAAGHAALARYKEGKWQEALAKFREADRLAHSPVFTLLSARCELELGQLLAARATFQRVAEESLPHDAPAAWHSAVADAKRELGELEGRIPRLVVRVEGTDAARARVSLDGRTLRAAELAAPIELDPGRHTLIARLDERQARREIVVSAGREREVVLRLESSTPSSAPPSPGSGAPDQPAQASRSYLAPGIAFGVGAAGVVAGTVLGVLASSRASEIKSRCQGNSCLASDAEEGASATRLANASTIAFVLGGVGIGAGVTLLMLPNGTGPERSAAARFAVPF